MYVFGGRNNIEPYTRNNELFSLDLDCLKWTKIQCQGLLPTPRNGLSLVQNDDILYVFGGYLPTFEYSDDILKIDLKNDDHPRWEIISTKNKSPGPRANHTCVFYKDNLYVIAGQRGDKNGDFLCDAFSLQINPTKLIHENKRLTSYVSQISSLYSNKLFSDISFSVENQEFFAHKNILAMRSEYFASMFLSGMQESQARQINIPDITAMTFEAFLKFLYTNTVDLTYHLAKDLLILSDKWLVHDLEEICKQYLKAKLSHENYSEIGQLAYFVKDEKLLQASIQYEIEEKMENFQLQPEFGCTQLP